MDTQPAERLEQARAEAATKLEPKNYRERTESVVLVGDEVVSSEC